MFGLKHLSFTAALLLIAVKGQDDDTYDFEQEVGEALRKIGDSGSYDYKGTTSSLKTTSSQE